MKRSFWAELFGWLSKEGKEKEEFNAKHATEKYLEKNTKSSMACADGAEEPRLRKVFLHRLASQGLKNQHQHG